MPPSSNWACCAWICCPHDPHHGFSCCFRRPENPRTSIGFVCKRSFVFFTHSAGKLSHNEDTILIVFGGKQLIGFAVSVDEAKESFTLSKMLHLEATQWIWDAVLMQCTSACASEDDHKRGDAPTVIALGLADNRVQVWSFPWPSRSSDNQLSSGARLLQDSICEDRSLLYCLTFESHCRSLLLFLSFPARCFCW